MSEANAEALAANAQGAAGTDAGSSTQRVVDQASARDRFQTSANDVVTGQDTGTDERYEVEGADRSGINYANAKRTFDLHQTLDTDAILQERKQRAKLDSVEMAEREQRLRHTEAEFNQRMRHADRTDAVNLAILGEMVEAIANKTADKVCERMRGA